MGGVWERLIGVSRRILESMLIDVQTLTHDVIVTLMAEVTAIINSRPLVPVSCDPEVPDILTPMTILTHKLDTEKHEAGNIDIKDLYRQQWRRVKHLANVFWTRWRKEYLQTLQSRRKWLDNTDNLKVGDVVLIKDKDCTRMDWPVGRVVEVFPSQDGKVRKIEVAISRNSKLHYCIRPIVDIVLLVTNDS
ncbi:uncharacterized protein LOC121379732 [Gigantopelta aegis]|uniref:uncharacterized protein LOC121379732 n=1 Tax=Gigantopelta aegis TaxID=1735272 RepID=UPI001B8875A9|nr:uncharacterized protein LOC121379732 [Gigantopelta aegis]